MFVRLFSVFLFVYISSIDFKVKSEEKKWEPKRNWWRHELYSKSYQAYYIRQKIPHKKCLTHCWTPGDKKALAKLYCKQAQISKSLLVSDIINFKNVLCLFQYSFTSTSIHLWLTFPIYNYFLFVIFLKTGKIRTHSVLSF